MGHRARSTRGDLSFQDGVSRVEIPSDRWIEVSPEMASKLKQRGDVEVAYEVPEVEETVESEVNVEEAVLSVVDTEEAEAETSPPVSATTEEDVETATTSQDDQEDSSDSSYYCKSCDRNHRYGSDIGQRHL